MKDSHSIQCPHCGEYFDVALDVTEGNSEFITDCEVCCRPMTVTVHFDNGEVEDVEVTAC